MAKNSSQTNGRNDTLSALEALIKILVQAKDTCRIPPAQEAFASVSTLLTKIGVRVLSSHCWHGLPILVYIGQCGQQARIC